MGPSSLPMAGSLRGVVGCPILGGVSEASGLRNVHDHKQLGFSCQLGTSCSACPLPGKPEQIHKVDKELSVWGKGMDFGQQGIRREDLLCFPP